MSPTVKTSYVIDKLISSTPRKNSHCSVSGTDGPEPSEDETSFLNEKSDSEHNQKQKKKDKT